MASTSFPLSNQITGRKFSASSPPLRRTQRISASSPPLRRTQRISAAYATAEGVPVIGSENTSQTVSLYEVLGIQTAATSQEIKFAYRRLARVLHPDAAVGGDASSADKFMRVHAAYITLSDPEKRAVYDSSLFRRRRRMAVLTASGFSEVTMRRRTWETDQCWVLRSWFHNDNRGRFGLHVLDSRQ